MKIIAPIVILALASAALYKTQEVFPKAAYEMLLLGEAARKGVSGFTESAYGMLQTQQLSQLAQESREAVSGYTEPGLAMYRARES